MRDSRATVSARTWTSACGYGRRERLRSRDAPPAMGLGRLQEDEDVKGGPRDRRRLSRGGGERGRRGDADRGQLERAAIVGAAGYRGAVEILGVLHHVAVTHIEDPRDVHAHRTLVRPVVDNDVRPARLV